MNFSTSSRSSSRVLFSSDNQKLVAPLCKALLRAGFTVDIANDYHHLEILWQQLRHDIVLLEVCDHKSIEPATASALRIKRLDARQFVAYLADANLHMSGLTGDAILSRDANRLPEALHEAFYQGKE